MIFIKIEGADPYIATDFTRDIEDDLVKLYGNLPSEDLNFIIENSLFIHEGQEQTSFQVFVKVLSPKSYEEKEKVIENFLALQLKNIAIHSHIIFEYYYESNAYDESDVNYPLYMTEENMVKVDGNENVVETNEDDSTIEPYMGNIFEDLDNFIASHPEMSKDEATLEYYKQKKNK